MKKLQILKGMVPALVGGSALVLANSAQATDAALITAVESAITAAGTGLSTVLIGVIAVVASFILFKLIKRGANKV